jgi:hypothetical protein
MIDKGAKPKHKYVRQVIKNNSGDGSGSPSGGGYQLPTEGIPKSDLSPGVKQSLDRADAAPGELSAHANNQDAHGLTAIRQDIEDLKQSSGNTGGGYSPPAGGIPKTDLSTEVQGLLAKAENAVQKGDEFSGDYGDLQNKPQSFPPSSHTHGYSDLSPQVQELLSFAESSVQEETDPVFAAAEPNLAKLTDLEPLATTAALNSEAQARLDADEDLSDRIDAITGSEFSGEYGDLKNKPTEFPPSAHSHVLTDLSSQVQDILGLAETALQEEEDPVYTRDKPDIAMKADLTPFATKTELSEAVSAEAQSREEADEAHAGDTDIHITAQEREDWNGKLDADDYEAPRGAATFTIGSDLMLSATNGGAVIDDPDGIEFGHVYYASGDWSAFIAENKAKHGDYLISAVYNKTLRILQSAPGSPLVVIPQRLHPAKAADSDKLDGLDSADFMRATRLGDPANDAGLTPDQPSFLAVLGSLAHNSQKQFLPSVAWVNQAADRPNMPNGTTFFVSMFRGGNSGYVHIDNYSNGTSPRSIRRATNLNTTPEWIDDDWLEAASEQYVDEAQFAVNIPDYTNYITAVASVSTDNGNPSSYTAQEDGFVQLGTGSIVGSQLAQVTLGLYVNGRRVSFENWDLTLYGGGNYSFGKIIPVKKGDVITCFASRNTGTGNWAILYFIRPRKIPAPWATEIAFLPDYATAVQRGIYNIPSNSTAGSGNMIWTADRDCFIQLRSSWSGNSQTAINLSLAINGNVILWETTKNQGLYDQWTALFPVKKGDIITWTAQPASQTTTTGSVTLYSYQPVSVVPPVINETFSTTETNTGKKWVNGNPIYRKCWTGNITSQNNADVVITLESNFWPSALLGWGGSTTFGGTTVNIGHNIYNGNTYKMIIFATNGRLDLAVSIPGSPVAGNYALWVEYTK